MASLGDDSTKKLSAREILRDPYIKRIIGLVFVVLSGFGLVLPIMPLYIRSFGVSYESVGVLLAAFGLARLVGDVVGGSIVDRKGERWTAVAGMSIQSAAALATGFAPNYTVALGAWAVVGLGSAITFASLFSYILKVAPKEGVARSLSLFFGAFNIGIIAGTGVGGVLADKFGFATPIVAYSCALLLAIVVYLKFVPVVPEGGVPDDPGAPTVVGPVASTPEESSVLGIRELMRIRGFVTALVLNFMYLWFVATVFDTLLSLFAGEELGMSTAAIGLALSIAIGAEFLVLLPAGTLADRFGRKPVLIPSLMALAVSIAALGWSTSPVMLTVILVFLAVASGFAGVPPAAILSDVVPTERSGRGVGAFRFCGDLGFFIGPLVAGAVSESFGFKVAFVVSAIPVLIALMVTFLTPETLGYRGRMEAEASAT